MPAYPFPNWIHPSDPTSDYFQGITLGQRQAEANVRIQEQQQAAQQASLMQAARLAQARDIANQKAQMDQQGLTLDREKQQESSLLAARQYEDLQGFKKAVASGVAPHEAVNQFPNLIFLK